MLAALQRGIPLARFPFEELAREMGCLESELIDLASRSISEGKARRFGAVFDARRMGFRSALCCASVEDLAVKSPTAICAKRRGARICGGHGVRPPTVLI